MAISAHALQMSKDSQASHGAVNFDASAIEVPKCAGCGPRASECWNTCGKKPGYCSKCEGNLGSPGACCGKKNGVIDASDPPECQAVPLSEFKYDGYHTCVKIPAHLEFPKCEGCGPGKSECWNTCGKKRHYCSKCESTKGTPGARYGKKPGRASFVIQI